MTQERPVTIPWTEKFPPHYLRSVKIEQEQIQLIPTDEDGILTISHPSLNVNIGYLLKRLDFRFIPYLSTLSTRSEHLNTEEKQPKTAIATVLYKTDENGHIFILGGKREKEQDDKPRWGAETWCFPTEHLETTNPFLIPGMNQESLKKAMHSLDGLWEDGDSLGEILTHAFNRAIFEELLEGLEPGVPLSNTSRWHLNQQHRQNGVYSLGKSARLQAMYMDVNNKENPYLVFLTSHRLSDMQSNYIVEKAAKSDEWAREYSTSPEFVSLDTLLEDKTLMPGTRHSLQLFQKSLLTKEID